MSRAQKKLLRNKILEQRNALSLQQINDAEKQILKHLLQLNEFIKAQNVFCYLSFRSEVPTNAIIEYCKQYGKNVYIPYCVDETKEMVLCLYDDEVRLEPSRYGVLEPTRDTIKISDRNIIDVAVMPGAVFDGRGYRIGYGAGYYDKFYAHAQKTIYKIALAYSFQIIDEVPKDDYDVPVDSIITEKGIIRCHRK